MANKLHYDSSTKAAICAAVLNKSLSVEAACQKHKLQPYQLYAWLGQHALAQTVQHPEEDSTGQTGAHAILGHAIHGPQGTGEGTAGDIDPELAQIVGEWVLRNRRRK